MRTVKTPHAKVVSLENLTLKQKMEKVLGWTELEFCNFQFEMGLSYLSLELEQDEESISKVAKTRLFWSWWRNHWAIRDQKFFNRSMIIRSESYYKDYHNPNSLLFAANNKHLETSYMQMSQKLNKTA